MLIDGELRGWLENEGAYGPARALLASHHARTDVRRALHRYIVANPSDAKARFTIGLGCFQMEDYEEAQSWFETLLDGGFAMHAHNMLAWINEGRGQQRWDEAIRHLVRPWTALERVLIHERLKT
jgi:tetratricopeptide (TPR) repeat protein